MKKNLLVFIITLLSIGLQAADFAGGNGSNSDPYQISNRQQLDNLRNYLGSSHKNNYYILTKDIDLFGEDWVPIGDSQANAFQGKLNGAGHKIYNLHIGRNGTTYKFTGLFGYLYNGAVIEDLQIASGNIQGGGDISYTGSIAGYAKNIDGGSNIIYILNCINNAHVTGGGTTESDTGGILGFGDSKNNGFVTERSIIASVTLGWNINNGTVTGGKDAISSNTGGIIGVGYGYASGVALIRVCTNNGAVIGGGTSSSSTGGIAGIGTISGYLLIYYGVNNGIITGGNGNARTGGVIGYADGDGVLYCCENNKNITGSGYVGGIVGRADSQGSNITEIRKCINTGAIRNNASVLSFTGGIAGWASSYYNTDYVYNNCKLNVDSCMNSGSITGGIGKGAYTGGIIGYVTADGGRETTFFLQVNITNNFSNAFIESGGGVAGGIVGEMDSEYDTNSNGYCFLSHCYSSGKITGNADYAGGIAGYMRRGAGYVTLRNSFAAMTEIQGTICRRVTAVPVQTTSNYAYKDMSVNGIGIISSDKDSGEGADRTLDELYKQTTYSDNGWNFSPLNGIWNIRNDNTSLPYLQYQAAPVIADNYTGTEIRLDLSSTSDSIRIYRFSRQDGMTHLQTIINPESGKNTYTLDNHLINENELLAFVNHKQTSRQWAPSYPVYIACNKTDIIKPEGHSPITIIPNPVSEGFQILGINEKTELTVTDISGHPILTMQVREGEYIPFADQPAGIYIVKLQLKEKAITHKIIKN